MKKLILSIVAIILGVFVGYGMILGGEPGLGIGLVAVIGLTQFFGTLWSLANLLMSSRNAAKVLIWLIVIIFAPFGWLFYYFIGAK